MKVKTKTKMDKFFMDTALSLSKHSHCISKKVGAVLVKNNRIISMGYNGSFPNWKNCESIFTENFNRDEHSKWSDINEIHAEMNCILFAAKEGIKTNKCTLYTTLSPCQNCLKNCIQAGIKRIVYYEEYDRIKIDQDIKKYMDNNNIIIEQFKNN